MTAASSERLKLALVHRHRLVAVPSTSGHISSSDGAGRPNTAQLLASGRHSATAAAASRAGTQAGYSAGTAHAPWRPPTAECALTAAAPHPSRTVGSPTIALMSATASLLQQVAGCDCTCMVAWLSCLVHAGGAGGCHRWVRAPPPPCRCAPPGGIPADKRTPLWLCRCYC